MSKKDGCPKGSAMNPKTGRCNKIGNWRKATTNSWVNKISDEHLFVSPDDTAERGCYALIWYAHPGSMHGELMRRYKDEDRAVVLAIQVMKRYPNGLPDKMDFRTLRKKFKTLKRKK